MWQRFQTLLLAISTTLVGILFFCPFFKIVGENGAVEVVRFTDKMVYLLLGLSAFSAHAISLLTFKFRMLQMRVSIIAALIMVGYQVLVVIDFLHFRADAVFVFTSVFPLVCVILDVMAARNIMLDEAMVQSASRLRGPRKKRK